MTISEIKKALKIEEVLQYYKVELTKSNMARCPFHEDKTPSLQVYPETNTYCCFSSNCNAGTGDQIQFIEKIENCTKHQALLKAKEMLGHQTKLKTYNEIFKKLEQNFTKSTKAQDYLKSRNINPENLEVGYNTTTIEKLKHCIIFPLKDKSGSIISLYGRSIYDKKGAKHYYTTNRKGLYNPPKNTQKLILTESIIDAITLEQITEEKVLALYGTNGLTEEHKEIIKGLSEVTFFFDGDDAGNNKIEEYTAKFKEQYPNLKIYKVETPKDEDVNSLAQNYGENTKSYFEELLKNRIFLSIEKKNNLNTTNPEYITYEYENLQFTLLGGININQTDRLKTTLKINLNPQLSALQTIRQNVDLYNDDQIEKLIRKASERLEISTNNIREALAELVDKLEKYRIEKLEKKVIETIQKKTLPQGRKKVAISYLKSPDLLKRTNEDIGIAGVIGEETNRLLMYLVFTSRLMHSPLHIISLGASGSGKTYLQEKLAELIPDDHKLEITALSENALYYFDRTELKHKLIVIEDLDGADSDKALLAIRELMSKKIISKLYP